MLSPCPGFPALPVISSLVRSALEFQCVQYFSAPLDCDRIWLSSSKDGLQVRVRVIPIFCLVVLLLLGCSVILLNSSKDLIILNGPFRFICDFILRENVSNLGFCPQLFQLFVFVSAYKLKVSGRLAMRRDGSYEVLPASVVGSDYTLLLRFAPGTLNVR